MTTIKLNKEIDDYYEYFYEVLKIQQQKKKIAEKGTVENSSITYKTLIASTILTAFSFFAMTAIVIYDKTNWFFWILLVLFLILLILGIRGVAVISIAVKMNKKNRGKRSISIDKELIISSVLNQTITLNWDNIAYFIIGKYSITFISKNLEEASVGLPIEYKEEVLDAIRKENVIIDTEKCMLI